MAIDISTRCMELWTFPSGERYTSNVTWKYHNLMTSISRLRQYHEKKYKPKNKWNSMLQ